jgi:GH43 family beta-xylosidase
MVERKSGIVGPVIKSSILLATTLLIINATAQVAPGCFQNPINSGPDPWMVYFDGNYYLSTTQGDAIRIWKASSVAGLKIARPVTVWTDTDPTRSAGIWAPEVHLLSHRWYMYYTATSSDRADDNHRVYVLEGAGATPLGPYKYKARLFNPANDHYAIDPTVFQNEVDGSLYLIWAARPGHVLYIERMANPYTLEGDGVYLPADGFGCAHVREGPEILQRNGRIFLIYSICDTGTPDYKLGMLMADAKFDLLDPHSWKQFPRAVFERDDTNQVFGPGHCGFFKSPDGTEDWIVYHAKSRQSRRYPDPGKTAESLFRPPYESASRAVAKR